MDMEKTDMDKCRQKLNTDFIRQYGYKLFPENNDLPENETH